MGADAQVAMEMKGLITSMALVTDRALVWTEDMEHESEQEVEQLALLKEHLVDLLLCRRRVRPKTYGVYMAVAQADLAPARLLQTELQQQLGRPVLVSGQWEPLYTEMRDAAVEDKEKHEELLEKVAEKLGEAIEHGVRDSDCLLVVLTNHMLRDPFMMFEVFRAMQAGINVVPVLFASDDKAAAGTVWRAQTEGHAHKPK